MRIIEFRSVLKTALHRWLNMRPTLVAGGLAFFALFSAIPLMIILLGGLGRVVAMSQLMAQMDMVLGPRVAGVFKDWVLPAPRPALHALTVIGLITLLYGASQIFVQLKILLDSIWRVPLEISSGWRGFLKLTLATAGMILGAGLMILAFVFVDAGFGVAGRLFGGIIPGAGRVEFWKLLSFLSSLALFAFFFGAIFKWIPDADIAWRDVWPGAILTSGLFALGKMALSFYFAWHFLNSFYGVAGSLIAIMVWAYLSAHIFLFGAVFTCAYHDRKGAPPDRKR